MKKCTRCEKMSQDNVSFCSECGSSVFEPVNQDNNQNNPAEVVQTDTIPPQNQGTYQQPVQNSDFDNQPNTFNQQPLYGTATYQENTKVVEDKANVGLIILSIFVPIVGIILWAVKKAEQPKAAKSYGKTALIMIIVNIILTLIISAIPIIVGLSNKNIDTEVDENQDGYSYSVNIDDDEDDDYLNIDDEEKTTEKIETTTKETTKKSDTTAVSQGFASDKWVDMDNRQFAINGKVYTLGKTTLQDMIDDGVPFDKDDIANANNNLNKDTTSQGFKIILGEYWSAQVEVANYTDKNMVIKDCPISQIYLPNRDDETQNILKFAFPLTMTESELKENAGEPTDTRNYSSDGYISNTYEYTKDSEKYYRDSGYDFEFVNGKLKYVTINLIP